MRKNGNHLISSESPTAQSVTCSTASLDADSSRISKCRRAELFHSLICKLTFLSGGYIYFESSYGKQGDTDCFYSPEIAPNTCKRFTFWYHMYGSKMGKLRVLVKSSDGSTKTVWERSCQQGFDWLPASVDISSETPFQVPKIDAVVPGQSDTVLPPDDHLTTGFIQFD